MATTFQFTIYRLETERDAHYGKLSYMLVYRARLDYQYQHTFSLYLVGGGGLEPPTTVARQ